MPFLTANAICTGRRSMSAIGWELSALAMAAVQTARPGM